MVFIQIMRLFWRNLSVAAVINFHGCCDTASELISIENCYDSTCGHDYVYSLPAYHCIRKCSSFTGSTTYKGCVKCSSTEKKFMYGKDCSNDSQCGSLFTNYTFVDTYAGDNTYRCLGNVCDDNERIVPHTESNCTIDFCYTKSIYGSSCNKINGTINEFNCTSLNTIDPGNNAMNCTITYCGNRTRTVTDCSGGGYYR